MEEYDKLIGDNTSYIVGQARLLHENFVEDTRPDAVAAYKKKLLEIIGVFQIGLRLAEKKKGARRTRKKKRKTRNE
jgi:hypothetical protein